MDLDINLNRRIDDLDTDLSAKLDTIIENQKVVRIPQASLVAILTTVIAILSLLMTYFHG
jgi:hypothetical protein